MVEDQVLFRTGLKRLLEAELPDCRITEASTAQAGLTALSRDSYDLVTTDLSLPRYDGLWFIQRLRKEGYRMPVLVLTLHKKAQMVGRALQVGADGYLLKSGEPDQFLVAVKSLLSGKTFVDPHLEIQERTDLPRLSLNSIELLNHLRAGLDQDRAQQQLNLSPASFQSLVRSLCRRLRVESLELAVPRALGLGLLVSEKHAGA